MCSYDVWWKALKDALSICERVASLKISITLSWDRLQASMQRPGDSFSSALILLLQYNKACILMELRLSDVY